MRHISIADRPGRPWRRPSRRCALPAVALLILAIPVGCRSTGDQREMDDASPAAVSEPVQPSRQAATTTSTPRPPVPSSMITASSAADRIANQPALDDANDREIKLFTALYRAAWASNVGGDRGHFLLDPPGNSVEEQHTAELGLDQQTFRMHVIAGLATLGPHFAWTPPHAPTRWTEPAYFPGAGQLATRLMVTMLDRDPNGHVVRAEIADGTAHTGGSKQRVTARWRNGHWEIQRDRARMIW